jgi:FkbM family methyltransferase
LHGYYGRDVARILELATRPGTVAIDAGAHIGFYTLLLQEAVGPRGRVLAFEPDDRNFRLLKCNLNLNKATNVQAFRCALGERKGTVKMGPNPVNFGDARASVCNDDTPSAVPMVCIDDVLADQMSEPVSVVKVDVQGCELHVVKGMNHVIESNPDLLLVLEVFPEGLREAGASGSGLIGHLQSMGYMGYEVSDWRVQPLSDPRSYDWLAPGKSIDCVLSRNRDAVDCVIDRYMRDTGIVARIPKCCTKVVGTR